jgi:hypothetical protein
LYNLQWKEKGASMKQRTCLIDDEYDSGCPVCLLKTWRTEVISVVLFLMVSVFRYIALDVQRSRACIRNRVAEEIACRETLPNFWTMVNPAYIHIWNIEYLKSDFTGSVLAMYATYIAGGIVDFGLFAVLIVAFFVLVTYGFSKFRTYMKLDSIKAEFKEKELRMKLSAEFDDKAKAVESRHKQLTAPSADPSIWGETSDEKVYYGEAV